METCNVANGTYRCQRPAGHIGPHESGENVFNSANVLIAIRITRFDDRYSEIRTQTYKPTN